MIALKIINEAEKYKNAKEFEKLSVDEYKEKYNDWKVGELAILKSYIDFREKKGGKKNEKSKSYKRKI